MPFAQGVVGDVVEVAELVEEIAVDSPLQAQHLAAVHVGIFATARTAAEHRFRRRRRAVAQDVVVDHDAALHPELAERRAFGGIGREAAARGRRQHVDRLECQRGERLCEQDEAGDEAKEHRVSFPCFGVASCYAAYVKRNVCRRKATGLCGASLRVICQAFER